MGPARGARRGPPEPSQHCQRLRRSRIARRRPHRHGVCVRRDAGPTATGRAATAGAGTGDRGPARRRLGRGAFAGCRPPGPQARQCHHHPQRQREGPRLRARPGPGRRAWQHACPIVAGFHSRRAADRNATVHAARAPDGRSRRRPRRHLQPRRNVIRAADGPSTVPGAGRHGADNGHPYPAHAAGRQWQRGRASGAGRHRVPGHVEVAPGPLCVGRRDGGRPAAGDSRAGALPGSFWP